MKEQFRDKIPKGKIKIQIQEKGEPIEYWETTAEKLFSQIDDIVNYYISIRIKLTNRQLYYQLVGKDLIPNRSKVYKKVCSFLTDTRYAGMVDWTAIEDKEREPTKPSEWDSVSSLISSAVYQYRLPRWKDQDHYVEMYCEKKAGINTLKPIAEKYHIYFGFNKGYSSASAMYDLAKRVKEQIEDGKKAIILYFGDHDPSGLDMVNDITKRITEFLTKGEEPLDHLEDYDFSSDEDNLPYFQVIPVSLTMEQIKKYNPPPNPAKLTDPRAKKYIEEFGDVSWELDSIDALELRKIAEESVWDYIDMEKYDAWIEREEKEKKALKEFGKKLEGDSDES